MVDKFRLPGQNVSSDATSSQETDWRSQLSKDFRDLVVNKLMDTMKHNLALSGQRVVELKNIAVRYEEMYYTSATGQDDYLEKICMKMLTMETSKNLTADSLQSDAAASQGMQSHLQNQVQQKPIHVVPSQLLPKNSHKITSTVGPNSAYMTSGPAGGMNPSMHAVENSISQGVPSSNSDVQICGSQQVVRQERHPQETQPYVSNHQLQHLPLKRKLEQGILSQSSLQSQKLFQESQLQSSQNETPQPSLRQSSALSTRQLNQLSSPLIRQHSSALDTLQILIAPHNNIFNLQKQQQATNQHYNHPSMHQQQLVPQNVSEFQQQMVGIQQVGSSLQSNPKLESMLHKSKVSKRKQMQQTKPNMLPDQAQQTQLHQPISEIQSQPGQLHQESGLQQSGILLEGEMQLPNQWTNSPLQELTMTDQQGPILQFQGTPKFPLTAFTSSSHSASIDGGDWMEELFKDGADFPELSEIYQRINADLHQHYSLGQQPMHERLKQLQYYNKSEVQPNHWEKFVAVEKQIVNLLNDSHLDDTHGTESTIASGNSNLLEQPVERLIKVMKSMSYDSLSASVNGIISVVSMTIVFQDPLHGMDHRQQLVKIWLLLLNAACMDLVVQRK